MSKTFLKGLFLIIFSMNVALTAQLLKKSRLMEMLELITKL